MAAKLNRRGFENAKKLIQEGHVVFDERDAWSEHQPSPEQENEFIRQHGFSEYAKWFLGIEEEEEEETIGAPSFPPKAGPGNTSIWTSRTPSPTCTG